MVIEDIGAAAEQAEGPGDEEDQVGRVAALDRVEAAQAADFQRKAEFVEEGGGVLDGEAFCPLGFQRQGVAVDVDAVEEDVGLFIPLAGRADDRHLGPGGGQRAAFVPDAAVEGQRQILDDDEDAATGEGACAAHTVQGGFGWNRHGIAHGHGSSEMFRTGTSGRSDRPLIVALAAITRS